MIAIDTNILIYSFDRNDLIKRNKARSLLRSLRSSTEEVILPWQVVGEFLRYLRSLQDSKVLGRADLERVFARYRRLFTIQLPSLDVLDNALDLSARYSLSHWDSILLGACRVAGANTLYTEDMGAPVVIGGIQLVNPFI
ncbi:unnamed protein product [uncultured bacterium]|nr:unnamed protein product [uncultured bacterium]